MNNLLYLKEKLEEHFNSKTSIKETPLSWGVDFVLLNARTGLPLGAFLLCDNLTEFKQEWKMLYKEMVYVPVYAVNASLWINKGILEISKWANSPIHFEVYTPEVLEPEPEVVVSNVPKTEYAIYVKEWVAPNGQVRKYINGAGFGEEKEANFNALYTQPMQGKLWLQDGQLQGQLNNLRESAKAYIMRTVNSV